MKTLRHCFYNFVKRKNQFFCIIPHVAQMKRVDLMHQKHEFTKNALQCDERCSETLLVNVDKTGSILNKMEPQECIRVDN